MDVKFTDNSDKVKAAMKEQVAAALEAMGLLGEGYAKRNLTAFPRVDTGRLRGSVSHQVKGDTVYVGTNVDYAIYVEMGTGIYVEDGTGRKDPWFYKDAKGKGHVTRGMKPSHFLKKAVADHAKEYKNVATSYLKGKGST